MAESKPNWSVLTNDPYDADPAVPEIVHRVKGIREFVVRARAVSDCSSEFERTKPASWKPQVAITTSLFVVESRHSSVHISSEVITTAGSPLTSVETSFAIESSVGWSKSIVGGNSSLNLVEIICAISVAARESKPIDINGVLVFIDVPKVS